MKRLTILLLVAALAMPFASIAFPALDYSTLDEDASTDGNLCFDFVVADGEAIILNVQPTATDWYPQDGFISIPGQVTGATSGQTYPVAGLGNWAFGPVSQQFGNLNVEMESIRIELPRTIRFIDDKAFQNFYSSQVDIVDGGLQLEYIGEEAFRKAFQNYLPDYWSDNCWFLGDSDIVTSFDLDLSSCGGVAAGSMRNLTFLRSVILPASIKIVPHHLFTDCRSLGEITIPATVTNIEACVFSNCSSLTNITFEGNAPVVAPPFEQWDDGHAVGVFDGVNPNCVVTVQRGTTGWGEVPGIWQGMPIRYAGEDPLPAPTVIDLSALTGDYTASDGDILTNSTAYVVTIPAGATVTINGMTVTGGGGAGNSPATFAEGGEAFTSAFTPGANDTWRLTAYAELASGSAAGLADSQIKVRRADTVAGLATAEPTTSGVTVLEKVPAVKVDLEVAVPPSTDSQFFRVEFGE